MALQDLFQGVGECGGRGAVEIAHTNGVTTKRINSL